jgi:hypothetical protein
LANQNGGVGGAVQRGCHAVPPQQEQQQRRPDERVRGRAHGQQAGDARRVPRGQPPGQQRRRPEQVAGRGHRPVQAALQAADRDDQHAVQHQRLVHGAEHQVVTEQPRQRDPAGAVGEPAQARGEHQQPHPRVRAGPPHPQADLGVQQAGGQETGQLPRFPAGADAEQRDGGGHRHRTAPQTRPHRHIVGHPTYQGNTCCH